MQAAIVPNADFLARFDLTAIRASAFVKELAEDSEEQSPSRIQTMAQWLDRLESTDIAPADIEAVFVSGNSDAIPFGSSRSSDRDGAPGPRRT